MPMVRRDIRKDIQANRKFQITGIKIDEVIRPIWRNVIQEFFSQVTMRINEGNAVSQCNVLNNQIAQQRGFARTGFSDDVDVLPLVGSRNAERHARAPELSLSDDDEWLFRLQSQPPLLPQKASLKARQ